MNIKELRGWGEQQLAEAGVDTPRLDANVLLAEVLTLTQEQIITRDEHPVGLAREAAFKNAILRRQNFEPVAYIVGKKEFFGRDFFVSPAVLIPRPETELLVERALLCFKNLPAAEQVTLIDVGTGSGAILLSLLSTLIDTYGPKVSEHIRTFGIDCSCDALKVARKNAARLQLSSQVQLREGDLLSALSQEQISGFVLITANLPYIPTMNGFPPV